MGKSEDITPTLNKTCENKIRGCQKIDSTLYLNLHQIYICPYRKIIDNEMCGKFNHNLMESEYTTFSVFYETLFYVKKYNENIKIKAQNVQRSFVLECKRNNEMKILKTFYKHNKDTMNVTEIGNEYFKNGICDWKVIRIKEEYTTDTESSCDEIYMSSDEEIEVQNSSEDESNKK